MYADRDILFGILALESGLIDGSRLARAGSEWRGCPDRPLADLIVERGWITSDDRATLEARIDRDLEWASGESETITRPPGPPTDGAIPAGEPLGHRTPGPSTDPRGESDPDPDVGTLTAGTSETVPWSSMLGSGAPPSEPPRSSPRYRIGVLHGRGGIGQVWVAHDVRIGREVALKELRPDRAAQPELAVRFVQEARITGQLEHPGIVPVYELVETNADGRPFYAMRLIRGRTLVEAAHDYHEARRRAGRTAATTLMLRDLLGAFIAACNAVAYAHDRGVIHRDLKGQNIVLGKFGEVMVLDWGLAKVLGSADGAGPSAESIDLATGPERDATLPGRAIGTPAFMSPEQAKGDPGAIGPQSDVYGLGTILYQILTDRAPFEGPPGEVIRRVLTEEPPTLRSIRPETPKALEAICLKAMAKAPQDRYESVLALASDVQHWLADEPITAAADPWPTRLRRLARRHRSATVGLATLLAVGVVALAVGFVLVDRQKRLAEQASRLANHNSLVARLVIQQMFERFADDAVLANDPRFEELRNNLAARANSHFRSLLDASPDDADLKRTAAEVARQAANIFRWSGRHHEAESIYAETIQHLDDLIQLRPSDLVLRADLASVLIDAAENQSSLGRLDTAGSFDARAIDLTTRLVQAEPRNVDYRRQHAQGLAALADVRFLTGRRAEALRLIDEAVPLQETLVQETQARRLQSAVLERLLLSLSRRLQASIHGQAGKLDTAESAVLRAIELSTTLVSEWPKNLNFRYSLAEARLEHGRLLARVPARAAEARAALREAVEELGQIVADSPRNTLYQKTLAEARAELERADRHVSAEGIGSD